MASRKEEGSGVAATELKDINGEEHQPSVAGQPVEAGGGLNEVREILFGSEARASEVRFAGLEKRIEELSDAFNEKLASRCSQLETFFNGELQALSSQLEQLSARVEAGHQSSEHALANEVSSLRSELEATGNALTETMNRNHQELQQSKAGRADLAGLLSSLAQGVVGSAAANQED